MLKETMQAVSDAQNRASMILARAKSEAERIKSEAQARADEIAKSSASKLAQMQREADEALFAKINKINAEAKLQAEQAAKELMLAAEKQKGKAAAQCIKTALGGAK